MLRQTVAANVGVTLLPVLAVQPPVPRSESIQLLRFRDSNPNRQIAMVWRKSSAMSGFLVQLAQAFRELPKSLFETDALASQPTQARRAREPANRARRA
jgi:LysR family hydrogen peroxide-inducible transcriptional activator